MRLVSGAVVSACLRGGEVVSSLTGNTHRRRVVRPQHAAHAASGAGRADTATRIGANRTGGETGSVRQQVVASHTRTAHTPRQTRQTVSSASSTHRSHRVGRVRTGTHAVARVAVTRTGQRRAAEGTDERIARQTGRAVEHRPPVAGQTRRHAQLARHRPAVVVAG